MRHRATGRRSPQLESGFGRAQKLRGLVTGLHGHLCPSALATALRRAERRRGLAGLGGRLRRVPLEAWLAKKLKLNLFKEVATLYKKERKWLLLYLASLNPLQRSTSTSWQRRLKKYMLYTREWEDPHFYYCTVPEDAIVHAVKVLLCEHDDLDGFTTLCPSAMVQVLRRNRR